MEGLSSRLDLEQIVFDGDRDWRDALLGDAEFAAVVAELKGAEQTASMRRDLLRASLKLTRRITPDVFEALEACAEIFGIQAPVEVYCLPEPFINAFVTPPDRGRLMIGISSAAIEKLSGGELRFLFGHELGHALFNHFAFNPELLQQDARIAPIQMARVFAWMRYAELSADRVGLICCGDYETAVRAFFKTSSGLSAPRFLENAIESVDQFSLLSDDGAESDPADWFSTHPYSPLRVRALDLFARSATFKAITGHGPADLSEAELEAEVAAIMRLMDPSFLNEDSPFHHEVSSFLTIAGMAIAMADGELAYDEQELLERFIIDESILEEAEALLALEDPETVIARLHELAQALSFKAPATTRLKVIEDLVALAMCDFNLDPAEHQVLITCAELLGVDPFFIDTTLERLESALD